MSGAPKRSHEEGSHPTTSKRALEESSMFPNLPGKFVQPISNDYHPPYEPWHDGRLAKVPRIESRDGDKRQPLVSMYRMPTSTNDSCLDHPVHSENRAELRDSNENRGAKIDNKETKADPYTEIRMDPQTAKNEKDLLSENRVDDKEIKSHRESLTDFKGELKIEKDENKESLIWNIVRNSLRNMEENRKEASTTEERDHLEAHEAVGENKVDMKSDEKLREKERKRKDEKHKEWGERDKDRNDRRNNLQLGGTSTERMESTREERERWERERRDVPRDKERPKDREKEHIKRETLNVNEKESLHEKEPVDGSVRMVEHESSALEPKRPKEFDSWKAAADRDAKDRRREKDLDVECDRHEKRTRCYDKESDDGCIEADGVSERDREVFGYGVQQRRRLLRPRGTPPASNREPRIRSRARDNDGLPLNPVAFLVVVKPEVSAVVYKAGECMQELIKLWKGFEASEDYKSDARNGPTLEIRVPAEYVTATNRQVRGGQLWGTDIYTDDSDLVAVLMHTGYCRPTASPPPPAIQELRATIRVLPPQDCYTSTLRNNVRSRAWGAAIGCSYRVERCCIVKKGGGTIDLEPCLMHTSAVEPTLAPVAVERTMTTRAAASNALRQQRVKYSISMVADKGLKKPLYTSARLKKGEVLYLETHSNRYELCFIGEKAVSNGMATISQAPESESEKLQNHNTHSAHTSDRNPADRDCIIDVFRWSCCKRPYPQKVMRSIGIPLPVEHLEVLEENIDWEDIQWSQTGVWIAGKEYQLARVHFLSRS
ncbi:Histone deacetylation protein Rxt3 [Cinnamomum micranthum f. kanehirae]|uniref:Histone deacetylation protein Rxt3 n=1 Tax=Cinnamomum micranthum f. kanehirae TaxID=337451 RepID=A0A443PPG2_9MAGN|nr:Histone deacetylation protein Rxt3 [Cinnamomum micranthum f. kanehirae]